MAGREPYDFEKRRLLWPLLNLNKRFLNSDFLANYSRGYVWAANQLGHFTLGLVAALGYFWFADTLYRAFSSARVFRFRYGDAPTISMHAPDLATATVTGFAFLVLGGVIFALGVIGWRIYKKPMRLHKIAETRRLRLEAAHKLGHQVDPGELQLFDISNRALQRERAERVGLFVGLIFFLTIAAAILVISFMQNVLGAFEWRAYAGSVLVTTLLFASIAALLSQSAHYTLMSWTVLAAAAFMWEPRAAAAAGDGLPIPFAPPDLFSDIPYEPTLIVLAAIFLVLLGFTRMRDSFGRAPWRLILILGAFFVVGVVIEDEETRRAAAAAFASLGVWWVKEFGADLPTVEVELQDAHDARVANGYGAFNGVSHRADFEDARNECFDDTLCDARTDGLFYFAGAVMAVGLLLAPSLLEPDAGRIIPAFFAAILFLFLYWWVGWYWIRRAVALDRVLVLAAQRFAMMESAIATRLLVGDRDVNPERAEETPHGAMQRLRAFARGELAIGAGDAARPIQHMIICGQFGSGRSALGHALACEAALVNAPPWSAGPERRTNAPLRWARYVTMRGVFERYVFNTRSRAQDEEELKSRIGAPDVFVIDQADPFALETVEAFHAWSDQHPEEHEEATVAELRRCALSPMSSVMGGEGTPRERLMRAMMKLMHIDVGVTADGAPAPDQTVWIAFADAPEPRPGTLWEPEIPPSIRELARDLRAALAARSNGALDPNEIPIAVAIVGRPKRPASLDLGQSLNRDGDGDRELIAEAAGV